MTRLSSLAQLSITCALVGIAILVAFLVARPAVTHAVKVWLLFGLGVLPIGTAATGNIVGYETTKKRAFCGSCHVMGRHESDAEDAQSNSLAARHARNKLFGQDNCYMCHADYGMYGTVLTKVGGMRHVWLYYTEYRDIPLDEALKTIHIRRPFPNDNCMQCHSTKNELWMKVPDHASSLDAVRKNQISCASVGCHGYAHPFDKK